MNDYKKLTNEDLLALYQRSDPKAFEEFFARTQKLVFNYLLRRLRNEHDAEEAFQDAFFRIHKYINTYQPEKNALSWLMTIVKNVLIDKVSKRSPIMVDTVAVEDFPGNSRLEEVQELKDLLGKLSPHLTVDEHSLLVQRFLYDQSYEEIAMNDGTKAETVRKRVSRLLQKIKVSFGS